MPAMREVRADFDRETIVVYQAYAPEIALPAIERQRFVPPFSLGRMTWIKPSFLWMMERSNWGRKPGQEHVLGVRISRAGWEEALGQSVLTSPERQVHADPSAWRALFAQATVHVQWDPERSLRGAKLPHRSIQVGISRHVIRRYVESWTVEIRDLTSLARKIRGLLDAGHADRAKDLLPPERVYPIPPEIGRRVGVS
ncbi:MAG: DUF4291 domain-containing protein [Acidobacteriota bacterium]